MIDVPKAEDYTNAGRELFDFAWDIVATLLTNIDEAADYGLEVDEVSDAYWKAAKRRLSTAMSITQQGVEFCLKGRIVEVSPFLLLADAPNKWPSPSDDGSLRFSDFRTIDAQDLLPVLDTFSPHPMSGDFSRQFHELRDKRNKIIHSVDKHLAINVTEVVEAILFMHTSLFPNENWASIRLQFLEVAPDVELGAIDHVRNQACWETSVVITRLKPAKVRAFFKIDKKQRRYVCPECFGHADTDMGFKYKLAVLQPRAPDSTTIYCPVCDHIYTVTRESCSQPTCKGNVQDPDYGCLTCCG